jgi:hypothetical protein
MYIIHLYVWLTCNKCKCSKGGSTFTWNLWHQTNQWRPAYLVLNVAHREGCKPALLACVQHVAHVVGQIWPDYHHVRSCTSLRTALAFCSPSRSPNFQKAINASCAAGGTHWASEHRLNPYWDHCELHSCARTRVSSSIRSCNKMLLAWYIWKSRRRHKINCTDIHKILWLLYESLVAAWWLHSVLRENCLLPGRLSCLQVNFGQQFQVTWITQSLCFLRRRVCYRRSSCNTTEPRIPGNCSCSDCSCLCQDMFSSLQREACCMMLELLDIEDWFASPELWTKPLLGSLQPEMLLIQRYFKTLDVCLVWELKLSNIFKINYSKEQRW